MYRHIMVPVDLAHKETLRRALDLAATLGKQFDARVTYVGVTAETPTALGRNPEDFARRMVDFAQEEAAKHGHDAEGRGYPSHDMTADLNDTLIKAADDLDADLIVIASHIPNLADHLWPSHGGQIARRAKASVFVVRDPKEAS